LNEYEAKITKVVDGDTVDALINLGFNVIIRQRVRMYGINTPESRTSDPEEKVRGLAAKVRLEELLQETDNRVILKSYGVGKFGRCLGELLSDGRSINQLLVEEGHAVAYYGGKR
tara:strand:- start:1133 stop:1477 length:345 start_codon:yes stop_codon:yes gene_type:complete